MRRVWNPSRIAVDKIGAVIGPGGKNVRGLQDEHGVKVDIQDDGLIFVAGESGAEVDKAIEKIRNMVEDPELGQIYTGKVTRVENYGAFVEFLPAPRAWCTSRSSLTTTSKSVEEEVSVGDEIMVMVINVDGTGRVRLSRQAVLEGWDVEEAKRRDAAGSRRGGGGDRRGPRRDGNRRGGDRRGGGNRDRRN